MFEACQLLIIMWLKVRTECSKMLFLIGKSELGMLPDFMRPFHFQLMVMVARNPFEQLHLNYT